MTWQQGNKTLMEVEFWYRITEKIRGWKLLFRTGCRYDYERAVEIADRENIQVLSIVFKSPISKRIVIAKLRSDHPYTVLVSGYEYLRIIEKLVNGCSGGKIVTIKVDSSFF